MSIDASGKSSIVERAKAIILKPKEEWPVIERETASSGDIFTRYALPLAAIGPVCGLIGGQIFGISALGFTYRPPLLTALPIAIGTFLLSLLSLFILSFIADKLAPQFGGESSSRNGFKLVVYSMTASWIAAIFGIIPSLSVLSLVGLYSFYLFYVGAHPMMKVPVDKVLTYTIVTVICAIVLNLIVGALALGVGSMFGGGLMSLTNPAATSVEGGTVSLPGGGTIDTGKLEQAARDMEAAVKTGGTGNAAAPSALQALLPASIGNYARTSVESAAAGPGGTRAQGTYESGDKRIELSVHDMAALGAMASLGGAFGVESNKEDADGYERTSTKGGNLVVEKWNKTNGEGSFTTMVGKRFMIEAEGQAGSIDELKAAVASIDAGKLAALSN